MTSEAQPNQRLKPRRYFMNSSGERSEKAKERLAMRHKPQQERSRARLLALLDAADDIITETGLQGLAMREVARRAKSPIASVYHYFPSTAALVRAVVERQLDKLSHVVENGLKARFSENDTGFTAEQIGSLIDDIAQFFFQTRSAPEIWASLHAYPDLRAINLEDTMKNAAVLQPYLGRFFPSLDKEQAGLTALILIEWVSATMRFAMGMPADTRVKLVATMKMMLLQTLSGLSRQAGGAAQPA
jgi:AcrR family transcriptional regulator